jgi:archaemetzincin
LGQITLRPSGDISSQILKVIRERVEQAFGLPAETKAPVEMIDSAYNPRRKQYLSSLLLPAVCALGMSEGEKVLAIVNVDLYAPGLNFVFGEASVSLSVAVISLWRLRQERYGLPPDENLFRERAVKEAIHELGHTYGLGHCKDSNCVMHFSNCLSDTDHKQATFCGVCRRALEARLKEV